MKSRHMTEGAAPCRLCGTEGGYAGPGEIQPERARGLCRVCYQRAHRNGTLARYPITGHSAPGLIPPPPTVDLNAFIPRYRLPWGAPQVPAWQRTVAYEQRRAEEWTRARRQERAA